MLKRASSRRLAELLLPMTFARIAADKNLKIVESECREGKKRIKFKNSAHTLIIQSPNGIVGLIQSENTLFVMKSSDFLIHFTVILCFDFENTQQ